MFVKVSSALFFFLLPFSGQNVFHVNQISIVRNVATGSSELKKVNCDDTNLR